MNTTQKLISILLSALQTPYFFISSFIHSSYIFFNCKACLFPSVRHPVFNCILIRKKEYITFPKLFPQQTVSR